jgi:hypothetical protein
VREEVSPVIDLDHRNRIERLAIAENEIHALTKHFVESNLPPRRVDARLNVYELRETNLREDAIMAAESEFQGLQKALLIFGEKSSSTVGSREHASRPSPTESDHDESQDEKYCRIADKGGKGHDEGLIDRQGQTTD